MSKTLMTFPTRFTQIVVDGQVYTPDEDGMVAVETEEHIAAIARLGGTVPTAVLRRAEVAPPPSKPKAKKAPAPVEAAAEEPAAEEAVDTGRDLFAEIPEEDAPEEVSATLEIDGSETPTESMTRPKMIEWLRENGVGVNANISKADAWKAIQTVLEKGN